MKRTESFSFIFLMAGVGCFALSFVAMGIAPWTSLKNVTKAHQSDKNPYYDESGQLSEIGRGRKVYIKEGCWHCHSQFVRPVAGEPYRYGPASQAWESMYDVPHTFGTRRVGPDLSRLAGRRSDDWHFAHLFNPRYTTPLSVMPSYPWLFEQTGEGPRPNSDGQALVRYLQNMGKNSEKEIHDIVYPPRFKVAGSPPSDPISFEKGEQLFKENCIGCHGSSGDGSSRAAAFMQPRPANLVGRFIAPSESYVILSRGVFGSAMPSFREMPERDLWALAQYVSHLGLKTKELASTQFDQTHLASGKKLFATNCSQCHGVNGDGSGPVAQSLNPSPKDFTRRVFSQEHFSRIVSKGIAGTAMPPFTQMSEVDQLAIWHYVTSLYQEGL